MQIITYDEACLLVKEKFGDDIDFVIFKPLLENNDNFIFPITKAPTTYFYIRGYRSFPIFRDGFAPLENVMKDVERIIKTNKELND